MYTVNVFSDQRTCKCGETVGIRMPEELTRHSYILTMRRVRAAIAAAMRITYSESVCL